jgi:GntR family transcriptional regulator/MocR family aminotransferase
VAQARTYGRGAFASAEPDCTSFPFDLWARLLAKHWRRPAVELYAGRDPGGYPPLRAAIAEYLRATRSVRCSAEQVIVVSGIRQAVDLAARVLLDAGEAAAVEEPGHPGLRAALQSAGAELVHIPVDAEGAQIPEAAANVRLACVAPSHQYPLGVVMSLKRRLDLIAWAQATGGWILEDDYDSEFRYAGRPLAAMQGLDPAGRVIYAGSLSKVLFLSLRLGYLVAPAALLEQFLRARSALDDHHSTIAQPALAEFFAQGHFAAHVRRMRRIYAARQQALIAAADSHLKGLLEVAPEEAGLHLVADLAPKLAARMDDVAASAAAADAGVHASALSRYYAGRPRRRGLLLGYAGFSEREIERKAKLLGQALAG